MPKILLLSIMLAAPVHLFGQQLYAEVYSGRSRINFDIPPYTRNIWYFPLGGRLAAGTDHFQLGGEYAVSLSDPGYEIKDSLSSELLGIHRFQTNYYGLFLRGKISRYPARRFGLTLLAGAGYLQMDRTSDLPGEGAKLTYDKTISYTGEIGISLPTQRMGMVELSYAFRVVNFKAIESLPAMQGTIHAIHLGFSLNFVFGKRATKYDLIMKN